MSRKLRVKGCEATDSLDMQLPQASSLCGLGNKITAFEKVTPQHPLRAQYYINYSVCPMYLLKTKLNLSNCVLLCFQLLPACRHLWAQRSHCRCLAKVLARCLACFFLVFNIIYIISTVL